MGFAVGRYWIFGFYLIEFMHFDGEPDLVGPFAVMTESKGMGWGHEGVHRWTLSDRRLDENVRSDEESHVLESGLVCRTFLTSRCSQPPPPCQLRMNVGNTRSVTSAACASGAPSLQSEPCRESFSGGGC